MTIEMINQLLIAGMIAVPSAGAATGVALHRISANTKRVDSHEEFIKQAIDRLARIETKIDEALRK